MFIITFKLKGGLNQITLFRFHVVFWNGSLNFSVVWYPLFLSGILYVILALLKSVSPQDNFEIILLVINGNWQIIDVVQLDFEYIERDVLFLFVKRKYFPVFKLKVTSKKLSIVIDSLSSLNKLIISLLNLSSFGPLTFCTMASSSSLCVLRCQSQTLNNAVLLVQVYYLMNIQDSLLPYLKDKL